MFVNLPKLYYGLCLKGKKKYWKVNCLIINWLDRRHLITCQWPRYNPFFETLQVYTSHILLCTMLLYCKSVPIYVQKWIKSIIWWPIQRMTNGLYPVTLSLKRPRQVARWFDYIRTLTQTHKIVIHFNMIKYTCYISSLFYLKRAFRRKSRKLRDCLKYKSIRKNKDIYEAWEFAWKA